VDSTAEDNDVSIPPEGASNLRHAALPRYQYWQNALRPEDTGHSDGLAGIPAHTDGVSHFEGQVRDYLKGRLGRTRNEFSDTDANFAAETVALRPDYEHYKKLLDEQRAAIKQPVVIRLKAKTAKTAIAFATLSSAILMLVLWLDKGTQPTLATVISICSAVLSSIAAYSCGLTLRQAPKQWHKSLAIAVMAILICTMLAIVINMHTPSFEDLERDGVGVIIAFAYLTVAACAFLLHDQGEAYYELERKVQEWLARLSKLEMHRVENKIFYTNVARRHVEIARRMIASYRQANLRSRPKGVPPPSFFGEESTLPEITDNWLEHLEAKQS
jgi:hypothetical protein